MLINKLALSSIIAAVLSTAAAAQQEQSIPTEALFEEEAVEVEHAHESEAGEERDERPVSVRTAPEEASATLDNVTWELLSRVAAQFLSGNRAALLSGNEPEVFSENQTNLASGNQLQVLSGNHISLFSNVQIDIHISGVPNPAEMMEGRREIRIETRNLPQPEARERGMLRDAPRERAPRRDRPRFELRSEVREDEGDRAADSPRDE